MLTTRLQDAGTGEKLPEEDGTSIENPASVDAAALDGKLLIPDTEDAARQYWKYDWNRADFLLPGSLTEIGKGAFLGIRAASVLVPRSVKKIGANAFSGSGVKRIRFENGDPEVFDTSALAGCPFVIAYTSAEGRAYETLKDMPNVFVITTK